MPEPVRLARELLVSGSAALAAYVVLAVATALFGAFRPSLVASTALFSAAAFAAGGRTLLSSAFGLAAASELRRSAMAMRASSMQFGYFTGSFAAGGALAAAARLPATRLLRRARVGCGSRWTGREGETR
jgi:hypothetical protein